MVGKYHSYRGLFCQQSSTNSFAQTQTKRSDDSKLAQKIHSYDRTTDIGWDFFIFRFLESGGLEKETFQNRLLQFWSNGYDWTQLHQFFSPSFSDLNGAELELLWKTFIDETVSIESAVCWTELDSLNALENLAKMEDMQNNQLKLLSLDTWFLYRSFPFTAALFKEK